MSDRPSEYWIGKLVRQVATNLPNTDEFIGRESRVVETFFDEKGNMHVLTEDGFWCPGGLLIELIEVKQ